MSGPPTLPDLFRIVLLLGGFFSISACATTQLTSSEKMMWSTYPLATSKGMATCLVINRKDPHAPHGTAPIILSSGHLLSATPKGPFYLAFRESAPGQNPSIAFLELRPPNPGTHPFVRHPFYDIAALRLEIPAEFTGRISFKSYVDENAIGRPETEGRAGDQVSVLGFPHVFPGTEGAFPVLRDGKIASYSTVGGGQPNEFLINTSVFAGDSGGPVFAGTRHGKPKLVGMIIERVGRENSGVPLAVAVNASAIRETLQMQAQQEQDYNSAKTPNGYHVTSSGNPPVKLIGPPKTLKEMLKIWKASDKKH